MTPAEAVAAGVARLSDAGAPVETRVATMRGALGRTRLRPVGEVWRLGALCLARDGGLFATGEVIIVSEPTHPNYRNELAVARNELRTLLRKGLVPAGTTVVVDARPLDLETPVAPLVAAADGLRVQWTPGGDPIPFADYLDERVRLAIG